jgi:hypothetical protein
LCLFCLAACLEHLVDAGSLQTGPIKSSSWRIYPFSKDVSENFTVLEEEDLTQYPSIRELLIRFMRVYSIFTEKVVYTILFGLMVLCLEGCGERNLVKYCNFFLMN